MAIAHIVVLSAASLTLLSLPCVVAAAVRAEELGRRRRWRRRDREERRDLRRLDRHLSGDAEIPPPADPSIEQLASDLRRLGRQRYDGPNLESAQWQSAVMNAYDLRLSLACRCLGVSEHLEPLEGMDRDLERLRVESELQAAGLALR